MNLFGLLLNKAYLKKINLTGLLTLAICIYIFQSIDPMWIHPDSMTAAGLRFLSGEWSSFHFATYGPFAFLVSGVMNALLFPIGLAIGSWKTKASFEEAYRSNHVEVLNTSFTNFSLLINLILILLSLKILAKIFSTSSNRSLQNLNLLLLFFAFPISLNQLTLDTIEIYTFFGISVALYASFIEVRRVTAPKLFDYFLVTGSFLLTIGMRINLAIFIIPIYFFIGFLQYRKKRLFSELLIPFVASLVTLISYLPLILNSAELNLSIDMYRSLGSLDFSSQTILQNFMILILNLGVLPVLIIPTLVLILGKNSRKQITEEHSLLLIWFSIALVHLFIFLFNENGFPKYLIPLFPIALLLINHTCRLEILTIFMHSRVYKDSVVFLISFIFITLGVINYSNFQSHSRFDTREIIMKILPDSDAWMQEATANITVITELSRGKYGFTYEEVLNRITPFTSEESNCKKLLVLSTRELNVQQMSKTAEMCGFETGSHSVIEISPYRDPSVIESSDEWLGFLSLGTPVDSNREGFGPLYELFIQKDWAFASELLSNCASSQNCRILQS